jgi:hypothetical protein
MKPTGRIIKYLPAAILSYLALGQSVFAATCGGVQVSDALGGNCPSAGNPIYDLIAEIVQYAGGVLGLIVVLMIVIAGLQYVLSDGSPDTAKAAKDRIRNAITGLVLFILMYGILELLLPPDVRIFG